VKPGFLPEAPIELMTIASRIFSTILIIAGLAMLLQQPAYAYTDPGTGLLAVQAVGSALAATGWYLRRKIWTLFHRRSAKPEAEPVAPAGDVEGPAQR
jgi:O-antigen/teichoic acid export membrane protein